MHALSGEVELLKVEDCVGIAVQQEGSKTGITTGVQVQM